MGSIKGKANQSGKAVGVLSRFVPAVRLRDSNAAIIEPVRIWATLHADITFRLNWDTYATLTASDSDAVKAALILLWQKQSNTP